jgi:hypothetical protein
MLKILKIGEGSREHSLQSNGRSVSAMDGMGISGETTDLTGIACLPPEGCIE